jgi:pyruvate/2-oxoglutarate dehydrogenase complex dihydrolipoamide acyltransferase (E2) component
MNAEHANGKHGNSSMITQILLPKLGFSMEEGTVTEWLVADGGSVVQGQPLYMLESEKSVEEIPAPTSGVLKILIPPGDRLVVGTVLGEIH